MVSFLASAVGQDLPDPVKLRGNVSGREPRHFADRRRVESFEIQQHELAIEGLELSQQRVEPLLIEALSRDPFAVDCMRPGFERLEAHQGVRTTTSMTQDV